MTEQAQGGSPSDYLSYMTRYGTTMLLAAALGLVAWLGACSDSPCANCPPPPPPFGFIASDPVSSLSTTTSASAGVARSSSAGDNTVYVTLLPGTVPAGGDATVHVVGSADTVITSVFDGGFDPVPMVAGVGDSIEVVVTDLSGAVVKRLGLAVSARRPPVVVRTEPPPKKRDQPLNAAIVVVFSEPVREGTLASAVRLFHGTNPVAGTVTLVQGTGAAASFIPDAPLAANADHRLVVTRGVKDLQGDPLEADVTVPFTTGQSSIGSAASITVSPDTVRMSGATYQMTATVRDAAGNELIDQPITWSTSDPAGLTVSPTGLVTWLAPGGYSVRANVGSLEAFAEVLVRAGPAASVGVSPTSAAVGAAGDTIILVATVRDAAGRLLDHPSVTWSSSDVAVATVAADSSGSAGLAFATVTGVSPGSVTITVRSGTASGTAAVTVIPPLPVASVTVIPASATLLPQGTVQLSATARDVNGKVLAGRPIVWSSDNATVATVDANGLVRGVSVGAAAVTATSGGVSDTAAVTVTLLTYRSVTSGGPHTCGLAISGAAYCWGNNSFGGLGDGSNSSSLVPVAVTGGVAFSSLSAGNGHTCGLTTSGAAYCWGYNSAGQLGDGTTTDRTSPVAVLGGLSFASVSAGGGHSCGVTTGGAAYCWGSNQSGQLGDGGTSPSNYSTTPLAVLGGLSFASVSAGSGHSCGVTTAGLSYCWGWNVVGQLGDGTRTDRASPVPVLGGLSFAAVSAGHGHTCGLTTSGAAYCWGYNSEGQLGDGTTTDRTSPVAVQGGLGFAAVSAGGGADNLGGGHTCGVTTGEVAYCWGSNGYRTLGDGTTTSRTSPVPVQGGLGFAAVSAGLLHHTCGVTTGGVAYCWGFNNWGQLGDGTTTSRSLPVKVTGQP